MAEGAGREVHWVCGSGPGRKRIRLNRKTPCKPRRFSDSISFTCVEETASCRFFSDSIPDRKRRRDDQDDGRHVPARCRTGGG